jgi:hypothetical protein
MILIVGCPQFIHSVCMHKYTTVGWGFGLTSFEVKPVFGILFFSAQIAQGNSNSLNHTIFNIKIVFGVDGGIIYINCPPFEVFSVE